MPDTPNNPDAPFPAFPPAKAPLSDPPRSAFPFPRLAFAIGFAVVAWLVFWALLILAALQFITAAISGHPNEELKRISQDLNRYFGEVMSYIVFAREERPFPFAPTLHD